MAFEQTLEPGGTTGQPGEGSETTTQAGPEGLTGQSDPNQTGGADGITNLPGSEGGHQTETVYDPAEFKRLSEGLSPEMLSQVEALQKGLQGNYTKKFQGISESNKKIEAYDAFIADPMGQMKRMAEQQGYSLTRPGDGVQSDGGQEGGDFDPQSWSEVTDHVTKTIMQQLSPLLSEVQGMKKTSIESQLSEIDPTWNQYEDVMMQNIKSHPTLAKDPSLLYRMSVPSEVAESRATQAALNKMQSKLEGGRPSGASKTTRQPSGLPDKQLTFAESVKFAEKTLADQGIHKI